MAASQRLIIHNCFNAINGVFAGGWNALDKRMISLGYFIGLGRTKHASVFRALLPCLAGVDGGVARRQAAELDWDSVCKGGGILPCATPDGISAPPSPPEEG